MSWFIDFVSDLTGDSSRSVSEAGHNFRDDSGAREGKDDFSSAPDWADRTPIAGVDLFPSGK